MDAKQKYLFDLNGYLYLENVLAADKLSNAQVTIDRLLKIPSDKLLLGISGGEYGDTFFSNGFSADKSLEPLARHPTTRLIINELAVSLVSTEDYSLLRRIIIRELGLSLRP